MANTQYANQQSAQSPQELQAQVEKTRAELADTVDQLTQKTDVKARAKDAGNRAVASGKDTANRAAASGKDTANRAVATVRANPAPFGAAAAGALAAVVATAVLIAKKRQRAKQPSQRLSQALRAQARGRSKRK